MNSRISKSEGSSLNYGSIKYLEDYVNDVYHKPDNRDENIYTYESLFVIRVCPNEISRLSDYSIIESLPTFVTYIEHLLTAITDRTSSSAYPSFRPRSQSTE